MERGEVVRYLTAGESHGPQLTVIIEGLPSQLPFSREKVDEQLARRQKGYGRGRQDADRVGPDSGVVRGAVWKNHRRTGDSGD